MLKFKISEPRKQAVDLREKLSKRISEEVYGSVEEIIRAVRINGDKALIKLTKKYDGVELSQSELTVSEREISEAYGLIDEGVMSALETLMERLRLVEEKLYEGLRYTLRNEFNLINEVKPVESAGCYIPGGRASYPSTALMLAVPARVAGVKRVIACTPPRKDKSINPAVLVALDMAGVSEIYRVGGAQAIAAMAYGTETIKPVSKVVGPGNIYVSVAKELLSRIVGIDCFAGPTELIVFSDDSGDPELIAVDLAAQAEHDPLAVVGLLTDSERVATMVEEELSKRGKYSERALETIEGRGFIGVGSIEDCIEFINSFAPEHLQVFSEDPWEISERVSNSGLILIGEASTTSLSDYILGTNHVLPTSGYARFQSRLSVLDFLKIIQVVEVSKGFLLRFGEKAVKLAMTEGLIEHARSIKERIDRWRSG